MTYFITIHLNVNADLTQFRTKTRTAVKNCLSGIEGNFYLEILWGVLIHEN